MKRILALCVLWLAFQCGSVATNSLYARHRSGKTISGKVMDEESKLPVTATLKVIAGGYSPIEFASDSLGLFEVVMPDVPTYTILVSAQGFDKKEETLAISEGGSNYVEILLTPVVKLTIDGNVFGKVADQEEPVEAKLTIYANSDFIKEDSAITVNGTYKESFKNFGWYIIDFSAPGFADARDTIWVMNTHRKNLHKDYHLLPLDSKLSVSLTDIHFSFDQSAFTPEAYVELNYLSDFLVRNRTKQLHIYGHTDSAGPEEYNLKLSEARAQSIADYLRGRGVSNDQLICKGFGEKKPIDTNNTFNGRTNNRRVELVMSDAPTTPEISAKPMNVYFDFGTTALKQDSFDELNQLVQSFNPNSTTFLEVTGYTDDTGPADYNIFLSMARARSVVSYLKSKGVREDQLLAKGFGEAKPIDTNATATGKANNRRVEITVINKP